jgi:uncharacterized protein
VDWTTNLFEAVIAGDLARVQDSISRGADVLAIVDEFDILSAAVAWTTGADLLIIELLIKSGANPNLSGSDGTTALFWAASINSSELVEILIEAGARVNAEQPEDGYTSLHAAAEHGNLEIVKMLLKAGGESALNRFDYISRTPLMCAVEKGYSEIARALIAAGSDVNAHDEPQIGNTALRVASAEGSFELVRLLVEAGADPLIPGWMGIRALDVALKRSDPEGRKILDLFENRLNG